MELSVSFRLNGWFRNVFASRTQLRGIHVPFSSLQGLLQSLQTWGSSQRIRIPTQCIDAPSVLIVQSDGERILLLQDWKHTRPQATAVTTTVALQRMLLTLKHACLQTHHMNSWSNGTCHFELIMHLSAVIIALTLHNGVMTVSAQARETIAGPTMMRAGIVLTAGGQSTSGRRTDVPSGAVILADTSAALAGRTQIHRELS